MVRSKRYGFAGSCMMLAFTADCSPTNFELSLGETILTNSNIDTVELLLVILAIVPALLVENSVNSNNSPAGLTVTNNKLTLTTTNWDHDIDWLESSHYRQVD